MIRIPLQGPDSVIYPVDDKNYNTCNCVPAEHTPNEQFIDAGIANKMIRSYLNSTSSQQNNPDLHSLIFDANALRTYLQDPSIVNVKLMFAHTMEYINNGGENQYAGYKSGALTVVIAAYDASGNYVYYSYPGSSIAKVIDHGMPCPTSCPKTGNAANALLL